MKHFKLTSHFTFTSNLNLPLRSCASHHTEDPGDRADSWGFQQREEVAFLMPANHEDPMGRPGKVHEMKLEEAGGDQWR